MKPQRATQTDKIDTAVRHITKPGANLFRELGFSPREATRLQEASKREINNAREIKAQLMDALADWIKAHELKQREAAQVLMVSRPRVSDVVNRKIEKFTIDTLIELAGRAGLPVKLSVSAH